MDRRSVIADAATRLIADAGLRSLTHRAIDTELGLPAGSTSYYYRTKDALLSAVIERIAESSRSDFAALIAEGQEPVTTTVLYLKRLLDGRAQQLRARHALLIDPSIDSADRTTLAGCLFSIERATELFDDRAIAEGYVALCEGLVVARLGQGANDLRTPVATYLQGARKAYMLPKT
nr:TetR family transcriptional regulator [Rhodococcus sp. (in: high G+C Gram-positive bacteria)]